MRFLVLLVVLFGSFAVFSQNDASAEPKPWVWSWWPSHWTNLDFQPYFGDQTLSQRSIRDDDTWTPEAWIKDAGDAKRIMRDFYAYQIVSDQYIGDEDIPVLEVGAQYKLLSPKDQLRVVRFVDHVFKITEGEENGMFYVFLEGYDDDPIGLYNKYGLQRY